MSRVRGQKWKQFPSFCDIISTKVMFPGQYVLIFHFPNSVARMMSWCQIFFTDTLLLKSIGRVNMFWFNLPPPRPSLVCLIKLPTDPSTRLLSKRDDHLLSGKRRRRKRRRRRRSDLLTQSETITVGGGRGVLARLVLRRRAAEVCSQNTHEQLTLQQSTLLLFCHPLPLFIITNCKKTRALELTAKSAEYEEER